LNWMNAMAHHAWLLMELDQVIEMVTVRGRVRT